MQPGSPKLGALFRIKGRDRFGQIEPLAGELVTLVRFYPLGDGLTNADGYLHAPAVLLRLAGQKHVQSYNLDVELEYAGTTERPCPVCAAPCSEARLLQSGVMLFRHGDSEHVIEAAELADVHRRSPPDPSVLLPKGDSGREKPPPIPANPGVDGFVIRGLQEQNPYNANAPSGDFYVSRRGGTKNQQSWKTFDPREARIFPARADAHEWLARTDPHLARHYEMEILPADVIREPERLATPTRTPHPSPWTPCGGVIRLDSDGRKIAEST